MSQRAKRPEGMRDVVSLKKELSSKPDKIVTIREFLNQAVL